MQHPQIIQNLEPPSQQVPNVHYGITMYIESYIGAGKYPCWGSYPCHPVGSFQQVLCPVCGKTVPGKKAKYCLPHVVLQLFFTALSDQELYRGPWCLP